MVNDGKPVAYKLTFRLLFEGFGWHYKTYGKNLRTRCPNHEAHNHNDKDFSCSCIEENANIDAGFNCFGCNVHGTTWDFAGYLLGFNGYEGHEGEIRDLLLERRIISSKGQYLTKKFTNNPSGRAIWFCLYPSILSHKTLGLKEALLFSTIIYYIRLNLSKTKRDFWNCSMKKVREQFLPFFTETTLWRSVKRLEATGMISTFTDHRKTVWRADFDAINLLTSLRTFPIQNEDAFQNERTQKEVLPKKQESVFHPDVKESFPNLDEDGFQSERTDSKQDELKKKKETSCESDKKNIPTVDIPDNERVGFQNESQSVQNERTSKFQTTLSQKEVSELKKYSNDFENDIKLLSLFKQTFNCKFVDFRPPTRAGAGLKNV